MKIKFLQKFTLIDYPGKIACTIFLFGCNFRCGFCYNPELVLKENSLDLEEEEILKFLTERRGKLEAVCFTGGEPLMTISENFLKKIKELGYFIKIDTNGSFPNRLRDLIDKGLIDYVAMDIKGKKEDYALITQSQVNINDIEESMRLVSQLKAYEFRTTATTRYHNPQKIKEMVSWVHALIGKKIFNYSVQGFKNKGKSVDPSFLKETDTSEAFLDTTKLLVLDTGLVTNFRIKT